MFARFARRTGADAPTTPRERKVALLLVLVVTGFGVLFFPATPANAAECRLADWKREWKRCAEQLPEIKDPCLDPPVPSAPDSGLAGWFASRTPASQGTHNPGVYIDYGYGGYDFHTYGLRCGAAGVDPGIATENMIANWELKLASGIVGSANAVREKAWDPGSLWSWADRLLSQATQTVYTKVFTGFGAVTLTIVGIYLIWRSRQADMSDSMTTAGWAVLVMLVVTAVAVYPVWSANLADGILTQSLNVVHDAVGPREQNLDPEICKTGDCADPRPPAERASEVSTDAVLYRNWLRGTLGSEDSEVAKLYGLALYDAQAFSWAELDRIETAEPEDRQKVRDAIIHAKQDRFKRVAEQIRAEDPEAYEHLQGRNGADRIGAGFIALISAIFFGLFDLVASLLVLLAFMIFRWAVIAAPLVGTVALLRPASAGLKRIGNAVVASIFNILIFGTGAAVYLLAVDVITSTGGLPGWLQVVLIGLCGLAGWILLRPYQRLTQLGGGSGGDPGTLRDRLFARSRRAPEEEKSTESDPTGPTYRVRPESRADSPILAPARSETTAGATPDRDNPADPAVSSARTGRQRAEEWDDTSGSRVTSGNGPASRVGAPSESSESPERPVGYQIYVPDSRRRDIDSIVDYNDSDPPEVSRPLFIPEEWRDEYADRN